MANPSDVRLRMLRLRRGRELATFAAAVVALAVPVAVTLPAEATTPSCKPGGPPVTYREVVAPAQARTYLVRPFVVEPGTTRVEVSYDWRDKNALPSLPLVSSLVQTVLDLGVWDQHGYRSVDGFRGWSGSRAGRVATGQPPVFIQQDVAQRGYRPDPIQPGTWWAEIGFGAVGPSGANWNVTITCTAPAVGPPFVATPVDPDHVANSSPGWYRGDFHSHGVQSNMRAPSWQEMVAYQRAAGLDFIPVTDYVTNQQWRELGPVQQANPDMLLWPGREIITYFGHMVALGETPSTIEYRHGFEGISMGTVQQQIKTDGALFQVAHPTTFQPQVFRSFCRGCAFDLGGVVDWNDVDTMEVLTGPILVDSGQLGLPKLPVQIQNPFTQSAVDLWVSRLMAGHKVTAVSGSDSKGVEGPNEKWGTNATAVYANELSRPGLLEAVGAGHAYVQTKGARLSPTLEFNATTPAGEAGMFGDILHSDTALMTVTVTGAKGQLLAVHRNNEPIPAYLQLIPNDAYTFSFNAARASGEGPLGTFYRVATTALAPSPHLTTIGNPIFLARS